MIIRYALVPVGLALICTFARAQSPEPAAPGTPIVYTGIVEQQRLAKEAAEARKKAKAEREALMQQMLSGMGGGAGGGAGGAGAGAGRGRGGAGGGTGGESGEVAEGQGVGVAGSGRLEDCKSLPPQVERAKGELLAFRAKCPLANSGGNQKFAINDYSSAAGVPRMYIFDASGACYKSTSVSYGSGQSRASYNGKAAACADANSHLTPPGFHVTVKHDGAKYNSSNSIGLAGLEGQGSKSRAILIHGSNNPGAGVSWGCSGVSHDSLQAVKSYLGYGALVYNSFDPSQMSPGCGSKAGVSHSTSWRMDPGGGLPGAGGGGGGGGSGSGGGSTDGSTAR